MKRIIRFLLLLAIIPIPMMGQTQSMRVTVNIGPYPNPQISAWTTQREIVLVTIFNSSATPVRVKLGVKISTDGVLQAETKLANAPSFTVQPGQTVLHGEDVVQASSITFHNDVHAKVVRTGELPPGFYRFCLQVYDAATLAPLGAEECKPFTIRHVTGPQLLAPENGATFSSVPPWPKLQWTGVVSSSSTPQRYQVVGMEVQSGQTPAQAFRVNQPVLEREVIGATQLMWPPDVALDAPMTCVWNVRALDEAGNPIGNADGGWAEPRVLTLASSTSPLAVSRGAALGESASIETGQLSDAWSIARNPDNVYDSLGLRHNIALQDMLASRAFQQLADDGAAGKEIQFSTYVKKFFAESDVTKFYHSFNPEAILAFAAAATSADDWYRFAIPAPSPMFIIYAAAIETSLGQLPMDRALNAGDFTRIISIEKAIRSDSTMTGDDRRALEKTAAVARYSVALWNEQTNPAAKSIGGWLTTTLGWNPLKWPPLTPPKWPPVTPPKWPPVTPPKWPPVTPPKWPPVWPWKPIPWEKIALMDALMTTCCGPEAGAAASAARLANFLLFGW